MQNTPNFNFTIAEGTDTVNLLTQCYPNFTSLDSILQAIKETGVTVATATKTGTNFAVVRNDTDCNFFRFIATANYVAGDTFTVDGVPVTATSAAGTALPSGAFVINQSVIAIVNSGVLTVLVGGGLTSVDASDVNYDNTVSGLAATDVQDAIDEVVSDIPTGFAATAITYDNTVSGLTAADVQAAIDELQNEISQIVPSTPQPIYLTTLSNNGTVSYPLGSHMLVIGRPAGAGAPTTVTNATAAGSVNPANYDLSNYPDPLTGGTLFLYEIGAGMTASTISFAGFDAYVGYLPA